MKANERLEKMMEAMQRIEQDLRDYKWMIERVTEYKTKYADQINAINNGVSKYGIEATLARSTEITDSTYREAQKLIRFWERKNRYEEKLSEIDNAVAGLTDERERAVAEGLIDGERLYMIAQQLNVTRQTVYELKKSTIRKLALELYGDQFSA